MNAPRYILRIQELIESGRLTPGGIQHIAIRHDDGCPTLAGSEECDCQYEIILPDGEIIRQG